MMDRLDGIIVIDKPLGHTSALIVNILKKHIKPEKIGYFGTLDPMATGVLPICLNEGCKLNAFINLGIKEYTFEVRLGTETSTYDSEGTVTTTLEYQHVTQAQVLEALQAFQGQIQQTPPIFSAIKQNGKPLYRLARKGVKIDVPPRNITIYHIELIQFALPFITLQTLCSAGTFIRSLAHDIGQILGCGGYVTQLKRTKNGPFTIEMAHPLDEILQNQADVAPFVISVEQSLSEYPRAELTENGAQRAALGNPLFKSYVAQILDPFQKGEPLVLLSPLKKAAAIVNPLFSSDELSAVSDETQVFQYHRVFRL